MAGIDKTYTDSYKLYKQFKDWADTQTVKFFDGSVERLGEWVFNLEESEFNNEEIPIMNTQGWMDAYLVQNCKMKFVLDRMNDVYSEDSIKEMKSVNFIKPPKGHSQNRKITIKYNERTRFPIHNIVSGNYGKWNLFCEDDYLYNSKTNIWVSWDSYYPVNTNVKIAKSLKAIIRHLRKQYLKSGMVFKVYGLHVGEEYSVCIK